MYLSDQAWPSGCRVTAHMRMSWPTLYDLEEIVELILSECEVKFKALGYDEMQMPL